MNEKRYRVKGTYQRIVDMHVDTIEWAQSAEAAKTNVLAMNEGTEEVETHVDVDLHVEEESEEEREDNPS